MRRLFWCAGYFDWPVILMCRLFWCAGYFDWQVTCFKQKVKILSSTSMEMNKCQCYRWNEWEKMRKVTASINITWNGSRWNWCYTSVKCRVCLQEIIALISGCFIGTYKQMEKKETKLLKLIYESMNTKYCCAKLPLDSLHLSMCKDHV